MRAKQCYLMKIESMTFMIRLWCNITFLLSCFLYFPIKKIDEIWYHLASNCRIDKWNTNNVDVVSPKILPINSPMNILCHYILVDYGKKCAKHFPWWCIFDMRYFSCLLKTFVLLFFSAEALFVSILISWHLYITNFYDVFLWYVNIINIYIFCWWRLLQ